MVHPKQRTLIALAALLLSGCLISALSLEWAIPSFPELFFGQLRLTRDSAPLPPRAYQSAEFVLGEVDYAEIERASYIYLQEDVLFWEPRYPGFPRVELRPEEVRQIQETLAAGTMVTQDGGRFYCLGRSPGREPIWQSCPEGKDSWEQFNGYRFEATSRRDVGLLLLELRRGRVVDVRVFPGEAGSAFKPYEKAGPWWIDGVINAPFPLLEELADRAEVEPIEVLWPNLSADRANAKARRILGKCYVKALEVVMQASEVKGTFGEIEEIRPARGCNTSSSWMDSRGCTLTFFVAGTRGEGVVLARGADSYELSMVPEGKPVQLPPP